ncbi:MAG TPA: hypothetical protein VLK34_02465 [Nocardioidaceae bacterium]|nr:hypothetical protein [Nocardioidaceae bacterium]
MRQVSVGPPLRIGALAAAIVLLANIAVSMAIDSNAIGRWLIVPAVGVVAAVLVVAMASPPESELSDIERAIAGGSGKRARAPRLRSMPLVGALAVILIVLGGGGLVLSGVARYGMGWITGNEHGPDRLVSPVSGQTRGLVLTVTRIEQTAHFTRVTVQIENKSSAAVTLPIDGGNCELIAGDGTMREAQPFRSEWHESVLQGSARTGVVVFGGHLPADATRARIAFSHLFASTDDGPQSIVVANLQLLPA